MDIDVEQLLAFEGVEYRVSQGNSGIQLNINTCPACGRDGWKVYLAAETGLGVCFRCSEGFNVPKFVKLLRGIPSYGAVKKYIDNYASTISYRPRITYNEKLNKDWKLPLNTKIELEEDVPDYLKDRNVDAKICKRFDLRVCEAGFYRYEDHHDRVRFVDFSNRIIIPVRDYRGDMVTFQGRDMTGTADKKYLFPNLLPGTGRYIYNTDYVIKQKSKYCVLNEGVFDVFATTIALESSVEFGEFGVGGTFGKHLSMGLNKIVTDDQLSDIFRLQKAGVAEFILLWDGETQAILKAVATAAKLNGLGFKTTVAKLSGDKDPAESTVEEILDAIRNREMPSKLELMRLKLNELF